MNKRCDMCGNETEPRDYCEMNHVEIVMKHDGHCWPEGGSWTETSFECCPDCFKSEIIPLFASFGSIPKVVEVET